jgi:hypothetical protein
MTKQELVNFYDKYSTSLFFLAGFLFDVATLDRIDDSFNFLIQLLYLLVAYLSFFLILTQKVQKEDEVKYAYIRFFYRHADDIHHFAIGSLLSAYALYFFKSASFSSSYLFLFLIFALLVLNELQDFKKLGPWIKSGLLKLCLTSFCCAYVPILLGQSGTISFLAAIVLSLSLSTLFGFYLAKYHIAWEPFKAAYLIPKAATIIVFLLLYVFRVFPPIPLALKQIGIYHNIDKKNGQYLAYSENPWYRFWHKGDQEFIAQPGDKVWVFIRLFAPGGLKQRIYLVFEKYEKGDWKQSDRIPILITGGREEGFRGRAYKANYAPGEWRVRVETEDKLEVGLLDFEILAGKEAFQRVWKEEVF